MTPQQLRNSILQQAIEGKLVEQRAEEGTAEDLYAQIQKEKQKLIAEGKIKKEKPLPEITEDEILFDIPESWKWVRLGNLLINRDAERIPLSVAERDKLDKVYDYYGASGIIDKVDNYIFDKKLLLIGEDGANLLTRSKPIAFLAEGKYWVNNHAHVLDCIKSYTLLEYVMYYINSISLASYVTGTAQPKMNQEKMNSILVPLPPLAEQKRIVAKIEELQPFVDKYEKAYNALEEYNARFPEDIKKSIIQQAIEGKLVEQRPEEGTAEELYAQIQEEKKKLIFEGKIKKEKPLPEITEEEIPFDIPDSWKWVRIGDLANYKKGPFGSALTKSIFVPKSEKTIKVYEQKNAIQKDANLGSYYITSDYFEEKMKSFEVVSGDIIVSCAGTIGEIYRLPENIEKGIINQALMRIRLFEPTYCDYYELLFDYLIKDYSRKSSKGSAIKNIPPFDILKNYVLPLPPLAEQKRIVAKIEELLPYCDKLK